MTQFARGRGSVASNGDPNDGSVFWKYVPHTQIHFSESGNPERVFLRGREVEDVVFHTIPCKRC